jgi:hypothetical protein
VKAKRPLGPGHWMRWSRLKVRAAYLDRLVSSDALHTEPRRLLGTRYSIADPARLADARARLDAIALSSAQVDVAQTALGGLAYAIGIPQRFYPRPAWTRMQQIAAGQLTVEADPGAVASEAATQTSFRASVQAVITEVILGGFVDAAARRRNRRSRSRRRCSCPATGTKAN